MPSKSIPLTWRATYELKKASPQNHLVVLLHGFQQSGRLILNLLESSFPDGWSVLAPDGPFPIPVRTENGFRPVYTWYFFDPKTNTYFREMDTAVEYGTALIHALELDSIPKTVIGYSQGGYLAPHLARGLTNVRQVIGINCRFRSEVLAEPLSFPIDAIHGARDVMVDPQRARQCHTALIEAGNLGTFHLLPEASHMVSDEIRKTLTATFR